MATQTKQGTKASNGTGLLDALPVDRLRSEALQFGKALAQHGISRVGQGLGTATGKLGDIADAAPGPSTVAKAARDVGSPLNPMKAVASKAKDALPLGDDKNGNDLRAPDVSSRRAAEDHTDLKVTNIVESVDVPVSRDVAYGLWTQFEEFPAFMKKVETVRQEEPEVVSWRAQILWSHRTWTAKIVDQVPPEHIVWKSEADKGRVDGAVTFHELAPDLTRVLVTLEYHPQGLLERTGNLWRAQGRRVRLELKHFRRHVANHALLNQNDVDGWEGEIHDGKVKPRKRSTSASKKSSSSPRKSTASKSTTAKKSTTKQSTAAKKSTTAKKTSPARKSSPTKRTTSSRSPRTSAAQKSTAAKKASTAKKTSPTKKAGTAKKTGPTKKSSRSSSSKSRSTSTKS